MRKVIIYDDRKPDKKELFLAELKKQWIFHFEIFPCIVLPNVVESISESFKSVIRSAKKNGDTEILIMEDDICFPNEGGFEYFMNWKPKDYDVYLGGSYLIDNRITYSVPIVKVSEWVGNHCIIVSERYYDTWLSTNSKLHCDTVHSGLGEFYVCFPFPAIQRVGFSANNQAVCDYNQQLPEGYIYK